MVKSTTQLARELTEEFPDAATATLARMLYEKHGKQIANYESARTTVRLVRGQSGSGNRKKRRVPKSSPARGAAPPKIPEPLTEFIKPWGAEHLRARRVLILGDVHVPFHDAVALRVAIDKGLEHGVDAVLLNGDFLDFFTVSNHMKDPKMRDLRREIDMGKELLALLRETFKGCQIWWKIGNHEERWERYMWHKAPELVGIQDFQIDSFMDCANYNIRVVGDCRPIKINKLNTLHGHEHKFGFTNPVNPARGIFLRAKVSTLVGHLHQTSEHSETDLNSKLITCWSTGCLCSLTPRYSPINKWNHGFAIVDTTGEDDFTVYNYRIQNGRIL